MCSESAVKPATTENICACCKSFGHASSVMCAMGREIAPCTSSETSTFARTTVTMRITGAATVGQTYCKFTSQHKLQATGKSVHCDHMLAAQQLIYVNVTLRCAGLISTLELATYSVSLLTEHQDSAQDASLQSEVLWSNSSLTCSTYRARCMKFLTQEFRE